MQPFVAIDVEISNNITKSICQLGIVKYEDGRFTTLCDTYVRSSFPFDPRTTEVHGITLDKIQDAPTFEELYPVIKPILESYPVIVHNANIVIHALQQSIYYAKLEPIYIRYGDTREIARICIGGLIGQCGSLESSARIFDIPITSPHNAVADARVCAELMLRLACFFNTGTCDRLEVFDVYAHTKILKERVAEIKSCPYINSEHCCNHTHDFSIDYILKRSGTGYRPPPNKEIVLINPYNNDYDPESMALKIKYTFPDFIADEVDSLEGLQVVVTGRFEYFPNRPNTSLFEAIEKIGGNFKLDKEGKRMMQVTRSTDCLIVGMQDGFKVKDNEEGSDNCLKAVVYKRKFGKPLIIDEETFYRILMNANSMPKKTEKAHIQPFVAVDVETANPHDKGSICQIGIVKYENGVFETVYNSLVKPSASFHSYNSYIHKITPDMVSSAPTFSDIYPDIQPYLTDYPVVSHNASTDLYAIEQAIYNAKLQPLSIKYACTCKLAKELVTSPEGYSLKALANLWEIDLGNHHDAASDAMTCAKIMLKLAEIVAEQSPAKYVDLDYILHSVGKEAYDTLSNDYIPCEPLLQKDKKETHMDYRTGNLLSPNFLPDELDTFVGKVIAITGEFRHITKEDAIEEIELVGGIIRRNSNGDPNLRVTKAVDCLIVGAQYDGVTKTPDLKSTKHLLAEQYRTERGKPAIIDEYLMLKLLAEAGSSIALNALQEHDC